MTTAAPARRSGWALLGLAPFAVYVLLFLAIPTVLALATGFFDGEGLFTLDNIIALGSPVILDTFVSSFWVSAVTAIIGAVVGALVCYALLAARPDGLLRTVVDGLSGVLAQFGGVMLAFAFIAAIGTQGLVTRWLMDAFGIDIFENGVWLYQVPASCRCTSTFRCRSW